MTSRQVYINQREARALMRCGSHDPDIKRLLDKLVKRVGGVRYAFGGDPVVVHSEERKEPHDV